MDFLKYVYLVLIIASSAAANELVNAAQLGDIGRVRELLNKGADVNTKNNLGYTALMAASRDDYLDIVKELINRNANIDSKSNSGYTALMYAFEKGRIDTVKLLLNKGASVNKSLVVKIIKQNRINLYPLIVDIIDNLDEKLLKNIFDNKVVESLLSQYQNPENYNIGYIKNMLEIAKKYNSDLEYTIDKILRETNVSKSILERGAFSDIDILSTNKEL